MAGPENPPQRRWARAVAPWLVTAAVVGALLYKYPAARIASEIGRGHTLAAAPLAICLVAGLLLPLALWDWLIFSAALGKLRYLDVLRGKAGSAVLLTIGYGFSSGGYGVWVARKTGAGARRSAGAILYLMGSDLASVCALAGASFWLGGAVLDERARLGVGVIAPAIAGVLALLALLGPGFFRRRGAYPKTLAPWATVSEIRYLVNLGGRILDMAAVALVTWAAARAFGLDLPLEVVVVYHPIILLVGALPASMFGFGAVQAAWLLYEPWAAGEKLLAFQFVWQLMLNAATIARGAPFLGRVTREIQEGSGSGSESGSESDSESGSGSG